MNALVLMLAFLASDWTLRHTASEYTSYGPSGLADDCMTEYETVQGTTWFYCDLEETQCSVAVFITDEAGDWKYTYEMNCGNTPIGYVTSAGDIWIHDTATLTIDQLAPSPMSADPYEHWFIVQPLETFGCEPGCCDALFVGNLVWFICPVDVTEECVFYYSEIHPDGPNTRWTFTMPCGGDSIAKLENGSIYVHEDADVTSEPELSFDCAPPALVGLLIR